MTRYTADEMGHAIESVKVDGIEVAPLCTAFDEAEGYVELFVLQHDESGAIEYEGSRYYPVLCDLYYDADEDIRSDPEYRELEVYQVYGNIELGKKVSNGRLEICTNLD